MNAHPCPVIWLASEDWRPEAAQASYHICRALSRDRRVLFCNSIGIRRPTARPSDLRKVVGRVAQFFQGTKAVAPDIWVLSPAGFPASLGGWTKALNALIVSAQIRAACRRAGIDPSAAIFWVTFPGWGSVLRRLGVEPGRLVLHFFDRWEAYLGVDRQLVLEMRQELLEGAGAVLAAGADQAAELSPAHPNVHRAPHGVDLDAFTAASQQPVPEVLAGLRRPIAGFFGTIDSIWLDFSLLQAVVARCPEIAWLFIGRQGLISPSDQALLGSIRDQPNVLFLGPREHAQIPVFARQFDVGLLPFKVTDLARSASPLKLLEYLAAGLPVISTLGQQYGELAPFVTVAGTDPEAFADAVRRAAAHQPADGEARRDACRAFAWPDMVETYLGYIRDAGIAIDGC